MMDMAESHRLAIEHVKYVRELESLATVTELQEALREFSLADKRRKLVSLLGVRRTPKHPIYNP